MAPNVSAASNDGGGTSLHMWHLRPLIEDQDNEEMFEFEIADEQLFLETVRELRSEPASRMAKLMKMLDSIF